MDPYQEAKPSVKDRLGDRKRVSYGSPESDDKKRVVKPKYEMDERILNCIICKNQLSPPVCQCKNNHMACQICCKTRTTGHCPKCSHPIGRTRNKAIEQMIASLRTPCKHGCRRMLSTTNRKQHELHDCDLLLLNCPFPGCSFKSTLRKYSSHVDQKHNNARVIAQNADMELLTFGAFHLDSRDDLVVLKARPEVFLLHQEDTEIGHMLYLTSYGKDKRYSMEVVVVTNDYGNGNGNGNAGSKTFKVEIVTRNAGNEPGLRDFLLIPHQNAGSAARHPHPLMARCTIFIPQN